jgi:Putative prokaryotic signal transducing protein
MVTLARYLNLGQAERDKTLLEAAGIPVFLAGENSASAGYGSVLGELQLQVPEADADRARRVLYEHEGFTPLPDDFIPPEEPHEETTTGDGVARGNVITWLVLLGVVIGAFFVLRNWNRHHFSGTVREDHNHDRYTDAWLHYENGQLVSVEEDRNFDGKPDAWFYYQDGIISRSELDENFDGRPDTWFSYRDGIVISADFDTDFDGVPDEHDVYVSGVISQCDWYEKTGAVFRHETFQHGRRYQEMIDEDGDGWFDKRITYDSLNRPIRTEPIHEHVPPPRAEPTTPK